MSRRFLAVMALTVLTAAGADVAFEVVSVKPSPPDATDRSLTHKTTGRLEASNATLKMLVFLGYQIMPYQLVGGPKWLASDGFDIQAKAANANATPKEFRQMVQALLKDRFAFACHTETRELPIYELVAAKSGGKLKPDTSDNPDVTMRNEGRQMTAVKATMDMFVTALTRPLQRQVVNRTGLTGAYTFQLKFEPDSAPPDGPLDESPPLAEALREQLGLTLKTSRGPVEVLVIDRAEKPTGN
jgi:uncharacterized protein (TIGR03435 family)